jgi:hypothetical protein
MAVEYVSSGPDIGSDIATENESRDEIAIVSAVEGKLQLVLLTMGRRKKRTIGENFNTKGGLIG